MSIVGQNRNLPTLPRPGRDAERLQGHSEQPSGHLFAAGDDYIIFTRIMKPGNGPGMLDQLIGHTGHCGNHDGNLMPGIHLAFDTLRHGLNAFGIGDRCAPYFWTISMFYPLAQITYAGPELPFEIGQLSKIKIHQLRARRRVFIL